MSIRHFGGGLDAGGLVRTNRRSTPAVSGHPRRLAAKASCRHRRSKARRRPKKAAAKKAPAKKAAAKKAPAKKQPAKKAAAKKAPAKKAQPSSAKSPSVTADHLTDFSTPPTTRWCSRRCRRRPNSICSTTGCTPSGARTPTPGSRCCSFPKGIRRPAWSPNSSRNSGPTRTALVVPVRVFWVPADCPTPGQGRRPAVRPRHLPAAGDPAAPHPSQGSVPGAHCRR